MPFPIQRLARVAAAVATMAVVLRFIAANAADQGPSLLFALIPAEIVCTRPAPGRST